MKEIETGKAERKTGRTAMKIGIDTMPPIPRDATDRNRTSPFAFTGNKFEFRTPGSSQNCSFSQMVLNTIVAESIDAICDKLEAAGGDFNEELQKLLQRLIRKHKRILFSGDGYDPSWPEEAAKKGLPNLSNTLSAIEPMTEKGNIQLFEKYGVLSQKELVSRREIALEDYNSRILIEGKVALEIARSMIRPVVADEFSRLASTIGQARKDGLKVGLKGLNALSLKLGAGLDDLHIKCEHIEEAITKGVPGKIIQSMIDLRKTVDKLETLVDDSRWPLPKYREMLFIS
jgi:glutamine synthetase